MSSFAQSGPFKILKLNKNCNFKNVYIVFIENLILKILRFFNFLKILSVKKKIKISNILTIVKTDHSVKTKKCRSIKFHI